jgi:tight adherence protein B
VNAVDLLEIDPIYLFLGGLVAAVVIVAEAFYLTFHSASSYRDRVNRRLVTLEGQADRAQALVQLRRERGINFDGGNLISFLWLNRLITQSGVTIGVWRLAALAAVCGVASAGLVYVRTGGLLAAAAAGLAGGILLPLFWLRNRRKKRHTRFALQFPDAIDIIVRSLRAGHPVPVALSMVAREMPDPVGTEFGIALDEITYGSDIETAMRGLYARVGQEDLPLFVTSVAIQSKTGGNLSQILDGLSKLIRERFKMRRKIRSLSAEGRMSALVLSAMPFVVFAGIQVVAPQFYNDVWEKPMVSYVLTGSGLWMLIGVLIMRKLINFKL